MVSSISSVGQYPVNRDMLEVIRRLQSLGVAPSGNMNVDGQLLQKAELVKRQTTLATNSEQNLNKLNGTNKDFSSMMEVVQKQTAQPDNSVSSVQFADFTQNNDYKTNSTVVPISDNEKLNNEYKYNMIGATQLGELNKIRLGLIA